MSAGLGDIQAGYVVALGTLATYAISLIARERGARRRLPADGARPSPSTEPGSPPAERATPQVPSAPSPGESAPGAVSAATEGR